MDFFLLHLIFSDVVRIHYLMLLAFLGREPSIRLNNILYERKRHYNPILNVKAAGNIASRVICILS